LRLLAGVVALVRRSSGRREIALEVLWLSRRDAAQLDRRVKRIVAAHPGSGCSAVFGCLPGGAALPFGLVLGPAPGGGAEGAGNEAADGNGRGRSGRWRWQA
jgi:hypothetical protein